MVKVTILYHHPKDAARFEAYYAATHLPLAAKMRGVARLELTRFLADPEGGKPAFYRMTELHFQDEARMQDTLESPEGKAVVGDLPNFATGGVTIVIGYVEA